MINIKTPREIELMRVAGEIVGDTHKYIIPFLKPGITTKEIDSLARDYIIKRGATPSCYNYDGYPGNICISINDEVVHGIAGSRKLCDGDIVTLDICACYKGYHGDSAWTYPIGNISKEKEYLLEHTEKSLYEGLRQIKEGARIGDIGYAVMQTTPEKATITYSSNGFWWPQPVENPPKEWAQRQQDLASERCTILF